MQTKLTAPAVLDREFLEMRAKVLQLAASFDRLDRAEGAVEGDSRLTQLAQAIQLLQSERPDKAEEVQMIFSRAFSPNWRDELGVDQHV